MNPFLQKKIELKHAGRTVKTIVIADRSTQAIHPSTTLYLLYKRLGGNKVSTLKKYGTVLLSLLKEIDVDPELEGFSDLTDATMTVYLEKVLIEDRSVCASTLDQHIDVLKKFFTFLYEQGWSNTPLRFTFHVNEKVKLEMAKVAGRQNSLDPFRLTERYIPKRDFEDLLRYESAKRPFTRRRNEIILRLGYEVGLRASEVVSFDNLTIPAIKQAISSSDKAGRNEVELLVIGKGRGAGKVRTVVIEPYLRRKIEQYIRDYSKIIGNHLITKETGEQLDTEHPSNVFGWAKKELIQRAPLELADRWSRNDGWSFHSGRHSYATNLSKLILDKEVRLPRTYVQDRLGHSNPRTTLVYIHFAALLMGMVDEADDLASELIDSPLQDFSDDV